MFLLNVNNSNPQRDPSIFVLSTTKDKLSHYMMYASPDINISNTIKIKIGDYIDEAVNRFNLKYDYYISHINEYQYNKIYFLYAETFEQTTLWKEWVESLMLMERLNEVK